MIKLALLALVTTNLMAQMQPLAPPTDPLGNSSSPDKIMLGKILYWDEQLSSTKTVACASCHIMSVGGTDPRASINNSNSTNPGVDGLLNTGDDVTGSPGVPLADASGNYVYSSVYGYNPQVTGRRAPASINAGYAPELFFDGRAGGTLIDPISNQTVLLSGAALETQALAPPTNPVEMGHLNRGWDDVVATVIAASPLSLSPLVANDITTWIDNKSYPELFSKAFGSNDVTPSKIVMAIASYERSLFSNQSPFDQLMATQNPNLLTLEERLGRQVFNSIGSCSTCHFSSIMSDFEFHDIGVTPNNEDAGRYDQTGLESDRGRFKTPVLRNLEFRTSFMHNGRFSTLEEVVDFYNRGGDYNNTNLDFRIQPLFLTPIQKNNLLSFLGHALTDPRVKDETGPFSHPSLYAQSQRIPNISGTGVAGLNASVPKIMAIEPPFLSNPNFTVSIDHTVKTNESYLIIGLQDPGVSSLPNANTNLYHILVTTHGTTDTTETVDGHASIKIALPTDATMVGKTLYGRWYVKDSAATGGYAISALLSFTLFDSSIIFANSFE